MLNYSVFMQIVFFERLGVFMKRQDYISVREAGVNRTFIGNSIYGNVLQRSLGWGSDIDAAKQCLWLRKILLICSPHTAKVAAITSVFRGRPFDKHQFQENWDEVQSAKIRQDRVTICKNYQLLNMFVTKFTCIFNGLTSICRSRQDRWCIVSTVTQITIANTFLKPWKKPEGMECPNIAPRMRSLWGDCI